MSSSGTMTLNRTWDYLASEFASAALKSDVYSYSKICGMIWRIISLCTYLNDGDEQMVLETFTRLLTYCEEKEDENLVSVLPLHGLMKFMFFLSCV